MRTKFNSRMLALSAAFLSNVMIQTIFPRSFNHLGGKFTKQKPKGEIKIVQKILSSWKFKMWNIQSNISGNGGHLKI